MWPEGRRLMQVSRVLPKELFERYEALLLQRGLNAMADVVFCPRCEVRD
jgi:hypothetical protein